MKSVELGSTLQYHGSKAKALKTPKAKALYSNTPKAKALHSKKCPLVIVERLKT